MASIAIELRIRDGAGAAARNVSTTLRQPSGCPSLHGEIGRGRRITFGGGRLRGGLGNGRFDPGDTGSRHRRTLFVLRILTGDNGPA